MIVPDTNHCSLALLVICSPCRLPPFADGDVAEAMPLVDQGELKADRAILAGDAMVQRHRLNALREWAAKWGVNLSADAMAQCHRGRDAKL